MRKINKSILLLLVAIGMCSPFIASAKASKSQFLRAKKRAIASLKKSKSPKEFQTSLKKVESFAVWTSPNRIDIYEVSKMLLKKKPVYFVRFKRGRSTLFHQTISEKKFNALKEQVKAIYPHRDDGHCEYPMSAHLSRGKKSASRQFCFKSLSIKQKKQVSDFVKKMNRLLGIKS